MPFAPAKRPLRSSAADIKALSGGSTAVEVTSREEAIRSIFRSSSIPKTSLMGELITDDLTRFPIVPMPVRRGKRRIRPQRSYGVMTLARSCEIVG